MLSNLVNFSLQENLKIFREFFLRLLRWPVVIWEYKNLDFD